MDSPRVHTMDFIRRILEIGDKYDLQGDIYWRCGPKYGGGSFDDPATFMVNCNDLFCWGCADCEDVTPENICVLEQACADCKAADAVVGIAYASSLFACRVRQMRPQGAAYPGHETLWPLFDAAGPERAVDVGNPKKHPRERNR